MCTMGLVCREVRRLSSGSLWDGSEPLWVLGTEPGSLWEQLLKHVKSTWPVIPDLSPCAVARIVGMQPCVELQSLYSVGQESQDHIRVISMGSESGVHLT